MECSLAKNRVNCPCTYSSCSRLGKCCDCIAYHLARREAPGCLFNKEGERTYDRSFSNLAKYHI